MSASVPEARALAPAKLNLVLEVLGKRADGYHELRTWMLAIDLCDVVVARARAAPGVALVVSGPVATPDVVADPTNLVWRAAESVLAIARARGTEPPGVDLALEKRIPSQSGLGGASADAAAAVLAVERVSGIALGAEERLALLATLGSDCAFFAGAPAGVAECGGRGELLLSTPARAPSWFATVFVPEARCSTAAVYSAATRSLSAASTVPRLSPAWLDAPAARVRELLFNRLETAAIEVVEELSRWRALFDALGSPHVRLTGSGSAFFALFDDRREAEALGARVEAGARQQGLALRGRWIVRAAGHGAKLLEIETRGPP